MFMSRTPVDELARLRAQISELRAKEAALEISFLEMNDTGRFIGFHSDVVVERNTYDVFDITKLPKSILDDKKYYAQRHVTSVRIEAREEDELPLFAATADAAIDASYENDDVIENP